MYIQPLLFGYISPNRKIPQNTPKKTYHYSTSVDRVNLCLFAGSGVNIRQKLNYADFLNKLHKAYKNKSLKNVIFSTIKNDENYIGSGFSADVYSIPKVDDYLIRLERKHFTPQSLIDNQIVPQRQNELAPNFGQYIATNNHGLFITKKVSGESHSLPNWSELIKGLEQGTTELTYKNAKFIFDKVVNLSQFPQKSFDDLAKNIQSLNKYTDCEIDIMNPNNLIVDQNSKTINIIDLWYKHSENGSCAPFNGVDSMINLMLDPLTFNKVLEKLNDRQKEQLLDASVNIIKKVFLAAEKYGLERNKDNAMIIYNDIDNNSNFNFALPAYRNFLNTFSEIL